MTSGVATSGAALAEAVPGEPPSPVVELVDVSKVFGAAGAVPVHALREVNLRVDPHESVAIVGPSGSGKSTLLNIIGCLDTASSGVYRLNGVDVASLDDAGRAALRGREIGFVFQQFHLLAHRSVLENVELGAVYGTNREPPASRRARVEAAQEALHRVGLDHRVGALARTLSGGEKQRVAIARALISRPLLLLADEPTGNLDSANTRIVLALLDDLRADGLTILMITHDTSVAAHMERQVTISDGLLSDDRLQRI